jgi:hypothetical protein
VIISTANGRYLPRCSPPYQANKPFHRLACAVAGDAVVAGNTAPLFDGETGDSGHLESGVPEVVLNLAVQKPTDRVRS